MPTGFEASQGRGCWKSSSTPKSTEHTFDRLGIPENCFCTTADCPPCCQNPFISEESPELLISSRGLPNPILQGDSTTETQSRVGMGFKRVYGLQHNVQCFTMARRFLLKGSTRRPTAAVLERPLGAQLGASDFAVHRRPVVGLKLGLGLAGFRATSLQL